MEIEVATWFVRKNRLGSDKLEVTKVHRITEKAYQISGSATLAPSSSCRMCGRILTDPVSIELGIGPYCAGIDQRDSMTQEEKDEYKIKFGENHKFNQIWIPKSVVVSGTIKEVTEPEQRKDEKIKQIPKYDVQVIVYKERICVKSLYQYAPVCKSIPGGQWHAEKKFWHYPLTESSAVSVVSAFATVVNKHIDEQILEIAKKFEEHQQVKEMEDLPDVPNTKVDPWLHQKRAFWFSMGLKGTMLALDMGCGKTKIAVDLIVNSGSKKVLIICPHRVIKVWPKEFHKHSDEDYDIVEIESGTLNSKIAKAEAGYNAQEKTIVVVNYESAWRNPVYQEYRTKTGKVKKRVVGYTDFAEWIHKQHWDMIILDESHKIKQFDGKAAQFCHTLENYAPKRACLTGTPLAKGPLDAWSQYRFLDSSVFGKNYWAFREHYAIMGVWGDNQVVGYKNQEEFTEKFYSIAYRVMADDVQDLPEILHIPMYFELGARAKKLYRAAEDDMSVAIGEEHVNTAIVLTKLLRCQQITSGYLPTENGDVQVDTGKLELVEEILDDLSEDKPVVICTRFTSDLDGIKKVAEKLGRTYGEISGRDTSGLDDKAELKDGVQICGVNIQAGGTGIDLTKAHHGICYSVGYSLADYEQFLKRMHRPGQENDVKIWHLVAENSVDEKVYQSLTNKKQVIQSVLER